MEERSEGIRNRGYARDDYCYGKNSTILRQNLRNKLSPKITSVLFLERNIY